MDIVWIYIAITNCFQCVSNLVHCKVVYQNLIAKPYNQCGVLVSHSFATKIVRVRFPRKAKLLNMNNCYEWYQYQLIERKKLEKNYSKYKWEIKLNHAFEKFKISCLQTSKFRPVYIQLDIQIDVSRISHFDVIRSDIWIIAGCPRDITLDVEFVCQSIFWISKGYICATWVFGTILAPPWLIFCFGG